MLLKEVRQSDLLVLDVGKIGSGHHLRPIRTIHSIQINANAQTHVIIKSFLYLISSSKESEILRMSLDETEELHDLERIGMLLYPRILNSVIACKELVVVVGGLGSRGFLHETEAFDTTKRRNYLLGCTNSFMSTPSLALTRDSRLYAFPLLNGIASDGKAFEILDLLDTQAGWMIHRMNEVFLREARSGSVFIDHDSILFFGGILRGDTTYLFHPSQGDKIVAKEGKLKYAASFSTNPCMYKGKVYAVDRFKEIHVYTICSDTWTLLHL